MSDKFFIDTNIWVYAHLEYPKSIKHKLAVDLLETLPNLVVSTQVLNEYYSVLLKRKIEDILIQDNIEVMIDISDVYIINIDTIRLAHRLKLKYRFSYWDSLVLSSALSAKCNVIYSEDMQHSQVIEDCLTIINPFLE